MEGDGREGADERAGEGDDGRAGAAGAAALLAARGTLGLAASSRVLLILSEAPEEAA